MPTKIEWSDETWNIVTGCTKVSDGCLNCYIDRTPPLRMAGRKFDKPGVGGTTGVLLHPERMLQPFHWRKPRRVFVCSLADLFHADVPDEHIVQVWAVMALSERHTFQVLTKRPARMRSLLSSERFVVAVGEAAGQLWQHDGWHHATAARWPGWPLPNVWVGVSAEDQENADLRIPILLETPLAVGWVSAEPLLGPVDLSRWLCKQPGVPGHTCTESRHVLSWVVSGGESGPGARPSKPDWHRSLRDQCTTAGVAYHFKQWGEWAPAPWKGADGATHAFTGGMYQHGGVWFEYFMELGHSSTSSERDDTTPRGAQGMRRVGKKSAGRLLDGRIHDEYPITMTRESGT